MASSRMGGLFRRSIGTIEAILSRGRLIVDYVE
jgi:hypothetical protein